MSFDQIDDKVITGLARCLAWQAVGQPRPSFWMLLLRQLLRMRTRTIAEAQTRMGRCQMRH